MNRPLSVFPTPTVHELKDARKAFEKSEPRDLFYRAATELVGLALQGKTKLSVPEALAVLLQTWNRAFYRFTPFDSQHFLGLERLINSNLQELLNLRERSIESLSKEDATAIKRLFESFEEILGPVGAAKCLHLLAPRFFPLWDRAIARAYGIPLRERGKNAERYLLFMEISKQQCETMPDERVIGQLPLKALDEYNYCRYTKHWT